MPTPTAGAGNSGSNGDNGSGDNVTVVISTGAIIGTVVGVVAALALIGLLFYFLGRKKKAASIKEAPGSIMAAGPEDGLVQMAEHPPVYSDPRYSQMPAEGGSYWGGKPQPSYANPAGQHPNRISELPAAYDPVEIYTPGPGDMPGHRQ